MAIKKDIETREDIRLFITAFYEKVKKDEHIGIIFTKVIPVDWVKHIPVITDFWETILLDNPVYTKNAMDVHYSINREFPFKKIHFETWLKIFNNTIDEMHTGEKADLAKKRAASIAMLMEHKMNEALQKGTL